MANIKRILSFDVGIINLAYCLMEINETSKTFKINRWGIIDLADNRNTCIFSKRGGECCDKIAKYIVKIDDDNCKYYCKAHSSKAELTVHDVDFQWLDVKKGGTCSSCKKKSEYYSELIDGEYCNVHKKSAMNNNNYRCAAKKCQEPITKGIYCKSNDKDTLVQGWCCNHFTEEYDTYIKKKTKKVSQNSNKISLSVLGSSMYQKLDQIPELLMVDEVFVENQPSLINPTMKTVSAMLFSYFIMRGVYEKVKNNSTIKNILFCSPSNKIKVGGQAASDKLESTKTDNVYKITKTLAVKFCKALIGDNQEWINLIDSHKKKDDMADAFLQGFIKVFGSEIPAHYAEKINQVDVNASDKKPVKTLVDKTVIKPVRKRAKKSVKADTNDTDDTNDKNNNTSNDDISSLNKKNEMLIKIGKKK
jgi:hypothetical protein